MPDRQQAPARGVQVLVRIVSVSVRLAQWLCRRSAAGSGSPLCRPASSATRAFTAVCGASSTSSADPATAAHRARPRRPAAAASLASTRARQPAGRRAGRRAATSPHGLAAQAGRSPQSAQTTSYTATASALAHVSYSVRSAQWKIAQGVDAGRKGRLGRELVGGEQVLESGHVVTQPAHAV